MAPQALGLVVTGALLLPWGVLSLWKEKPWGLGSGPEPRSRLSAPGEASSCCPARAGSVCPERSPVPSAHGPVEALPEPVVWQLG